jgi:hypothetical protein
MKFKSYKSEVVDVAEKGIVTIAISKFNTEDMGGDIVRKGAFMKTFKEDNGRIKHVIDHQLKASAIVGLPIKMYESDTHAVVESALNLEKEISRDLFSDYKFFKEHGKSLEHSFGYLTTKQGSLKLKGEEILELKMYEYTTTAVGMMADTPLLSLKSFDVSALEQYLRKYDVSDNKGKQIEGIIMQIKAMAMGNGADMEFIDRMIPHHQMAIEMVNEFQGKVKNTTLIKIMQNIVSSQTAEIDKMNMIKKEPSNDTPVNEPMGKSLIKLNELLKTKNIFN